MEINRADSAMMLGSVVFAVVIREVVCTGLPMDGVLALGDAVLEPVESHVKSFGSFLFDGVSEDALA